jgi:uncharacterized membrane protein
MNIALWIAQGLLAAAFLMAGMMKVVKSKDELAERMGWFEDFSESTIKVIGGLEVLGAIGLILPGVTGIAPVLVPVSAVGLASIQVGAFIVHVRRDEARQVVMNSVLLALAVFVAWAALVTTRSSRVVLVGATIRPGPWRSVESLRRFESPGVAPTSS